MEVKWCHKKWCQLTPFDRSQIHPSVAKNQTKYFLYKDSTVVQFDRSAAVEFDTKGVILGWPLFQGRDRRS